MVVTGVGVVSAIGTGREDFWSAACAGRVGTGELSLFDTDGCISRQGGEIRGWAPNLPAGADRWGPLTRSETFALSATRMALEDGRLLWPQHGSAGSQPGLREVDPERVGVCFGIVTGNRPGVEGPLRGLHRDGFGDHPPVPGHAPARISALPATLYGLGGPNLVLPTACAAGNNALAQAAEAVAEGRAEVMVAGGSDELSEAMFLMFNSFRALAPRHVQPFDTHRAGLLLGEGAGVLLLEAEESALARGAKVYAVFAGHGSYADAHHMTAPHPEGDGAARSLRAALSMAQLSPADVDFVSAHGTGTPSNDAAEARGIGQAFDRPVPVTALKSLLGHAQGAAGAIAAVACVLAVRDGLIPPTANVDSVDPDCEAAGIDLVRGTARRGPVRAVLNNAFGFGGNNCCTAFTAYEPPGAGRRRAGEEELTRT